MRSRSSIVAVAVAAAVVHASSGTARAAGADATPAHVRVEAPAECATAASFWDALARRTDRLRPAARGDDAASIEITLSRATAATEGSATGELRIVRDGVPSDRRRISAGTCGEVTESLSLIAALAFDPTAKLDVAPAPTPPPPEPSAPASFEPARVEPARDAAREAPPPNAAPPRSARWRFGLGALGGGHALGASDVSLALGGFVEAEVDRAGLAPSLRLGAIRADGESSAGAVSASLSWTVGRASVCPARFDLGRVLALRPCVGLDAGALTATARGVDRSNDRSRPWVAATAAARLAWAPSRLVFVEIQGSLALPVVRDEIVVDRASQADGPAFSLYRAPILVPSAELATGVRFP